MSQPKRVNDDGSYTPIPTMNKAEWDALRSEPMSTWARRIGSRQITVNSAPRIVVRGRLKRLIKQALQPANA